jgi:hypothetical protein
LSLSALLRHAVFISRLLLEPCGAG